MEKIKLTSYSHGAGCGCKIAPKVLDEILKTGSNPLKDPALLIGNDTRDDAAVYAIDEQKAVISTTDFFMPIVDDPHDFGGIAAVNAISDIYAMGGKPLLAISILGWPVDKLAPEIAGQVVEGARQACNRAGIPLAGGHSIDSPEPIFGLAVTGIIDRDKVKANTGAVPDCDLFLTKPLGIGILTTAQKKGIVEPADLEAAVKIMLTLNRIGQELSQLNGVRAMTDVTGFGLLGHLIELCEASNVSAEIRFRDVPVLERLEKYIDKGSLPGGTHRNFNSYGEKVSALTDLQKAVLCDPQTSGGLLVAVEAQDRKKFLELIAKFGLEIKSFGKIVPRMKTLIEVS